MTLAELLFANGCRFTRECITCSLLFCNRNITLTQWRKKQKRTGMRIGKRSGIAAKDCCTGKATGSPGAKG